MSNELILAAAAGNLDKINRLLDTPGIDINHAGIPLEMVDETRFPISALTAAIWHQQWEVAKLLIQRGANIETDDPTAYSHLETSVGPYIQCYLDFRVVDTSLLKMILAKVKVLNPFVIVGPSPREKLVQRIQRVCADVSNIKNLVETKLANSLLFHEAVLRNDTSAISDFLTGNSIPHMNRETMTDYVAGRAISPSMALAASEAIDSLKLHKLGNDSEEIKKFLNDISFVLSVKIFPAPLKKYLQLVTPGKLSDLYAELVYLLFPEEKLIPYSVESTLFKHEDLSKLEKSPDELKSWQNPQRLALLCDMDMTTLLMCFHASTSSTREMNCRAAELLAEILLHHDTVLNKSQQQYLVGLLNKLYALSDTERLALTLAKQQQTQITALQQKCDAMENTIEKQTQLIDGKLERLLCLLASEKEVAKKTEIGFFK